MIVLLQKAREECMFQPMSFITFFWLYAPIPDKAFVLETTGGTLVRLTRMALLIRKTLKALDKRVHTQERYTIKSWRMSYER